VKVSVKASSRPDKDAILKRMTELDKHALNSYLTDAEKLIRSASMGDKTAIERLKGEDYRRYEEALIKLIELGRLELKEEK